MNIINITVMKINQLFISVTLTVVKLGNAPIKRARVVNPKAKPALPGKTFAKTARVTGIVMLNINTPIIAKNG